MAYSLEIKRNDYTEDVDYFCSADCMEKKVNSVTSGVHGRFDAGSFEGNGVVYSWGKVYSTETDTDVWDKVCGEFLWHGLECECEDRQTERDPLTEDKLDKV